MKISDRFTDYGLIGGFFWLIQLAMWCIIKHLGPAGFLQFVTSQLGALSTPAATLLGACGLIAVFVTGVILDLFGSQVLRNSEVVVFGELARQNAGWFGLIAERSKPYIGEDFEATLRVPTLKAIFKAYIFRFRRIIPVLRRLKHEALMPNRAPGAYVRLNSFLVGYVTLKAGGDKLDVINFQMSIWRDSRAIAAALFISFIGDVLSMTLYSSGLTVFVLWLIELVLGFAAIWISMAAYRGVCEMLFALVYIISEQDKPTPHSSST